MTIHQRIEDERAEAARADISEGLFRYLVAAVEIMERIDHVADVDRQLHGREAERVAAMLRRDRDADRAERRRAEAEVEVAEGRFASLTDATIGPTPEQMASGAFRPYTVDKRKGSVRSVTTVRRVLVDRLVQLHGRGVIDDDQLAACVWYRRQWEATGFGASPSVSRFSLAPGGRPRRDHLPPTEAGWEAWQLFRMAREGIPEDVRRLFDRVVLDELTIDDAARVCRCGYRNGAAAFRRGALALHGTIAHMLPVRSL